MKKIIFLFVFSLSYLLISAQSFTISGKVIDSVTGDPVEGAAVAIQNTSVGELTNSQGYFNFCHLNKGKYVLLIEHMGYKKDTTYIDLKDSIMVLHIRLQSLGITLSEITIKTQDPAVKSVRIDRTPYDKWNPDFIKTLSTIPGTTTMNIGGNVSKPVIRGLSFNRVAVINRGIVQQNQQWGADHGLDINMLDMELTNVYKGPNALLFGSASMAAIEIEPFGFKNKNDFISTEAIFIGGSNNGMLGGGIITEVQKKNWYFRGTYSYKGYNDYRVPASSVQYEEESIELKDKRIPNSAGREQSVSGTIGYKTSKLTSYINISNNYQKIGIFELEHDDHEGHNHEEEDHDHDHDVDTSHSNIGLPYSTANHLSATNNTEWKRNSNLRLLVNTGFQYNHRREFEHFHEHYEGQTAPAIDNDIAVDFKLRTYSTNARLYWDESEKWTKTFSANIEYMQNRIGGFEYFLPRYNQLSGGFSFVNNYNLSEKWLLSAGLRFDLGHMDITGFYDAALAEHLTQEGYDQQTVQQYAQRAYDVNRSFNSWSGNIGAKYKLNDLTIRMQIGKSYRFPSANELSANGVHHAAHRYEIGNPNLKPEHGYTFDLGLNYSNYPELSIEFSPFISYYHNFIYLEAVSESPVVLYEEQPYMYSQAKTISGGGEYKIAWRVVKKLELSNAGSLVLNKNLDTHDPLPFTPPFTMINELRFLDDTRAHKKISYYQVSLSHKWYANQNRTGIGEEKTPGTSLFNFNAGLVYQLGKKCAIDVNMQINNIFNTRYLNHLSLYRRLNIPEMGRNIQFIVRIPFKS